MAHSFRGSTGSVRFRLGSPKADVTHRGTTLHAPAAQGRAPYSEGTGKPVPFAFLAPGIG